MTEEEDLCLSSELFVVLRRDGAREIESAGRTSGVVSFSSITGGVVPLLVEPLSDQVESEGHQVSFTT
jgi:hypothetical protein